MARSKTKKPLIYSTTGFAKAHQAPGMNHADRAAARAKGLLREEPPRTRPAKTRSRAGIDPEPRRGRRPMKSRHLRFPEEIDRELQHLVEHYESTMVGVLKALIHDEWLKVRREELRASRSEGQDGVLTPGSGDEPASG